MKTYILPILFLCALGLTPPLSGPALAAEDAAEVEGALPEVVVTGTRFAQEIEKIPAQVTVITSDEIRESGAGSVPEVLESLGGVFVRDLNGNGNNQTVDMGGFGETADRHVAVVINGRRVNPIDQSGLRWSTIPVENVERIEVLYGSGAVLYGDNAMGGVINIITRDWDGEAKIGGELAGGNLKTKRGTANASFGTDRVGVLLGATVSSTDGYRDRSERDAHHFYNKVRIEATDSASLFFEMNMSRAEYQLPGALTEAQRDADRRQSIYPNDGGVDKDASVIGGVEFDWQDWGQWTLTLGHRKEDRNSYIASFFSFIDYIMTTDSVTSQYVLDRPFGAHANRLTLGVDLYDTDYESSGGFFIGATTNTNDHTKQTLAGYVQDEFSILDNLVLNAGVRYEKPDTKLDSNVGGTLAKAEFDDAEWAWNLGLAYTFMPRSTLYTRVYRAFRYPVVDEYTNLFTGAVNTNLTQETALGYEAGVRLALTERCRLNLRLYWMDVEDEIFYNLLTNQNENLEETRHIGSELDLRYKATPFLTLYGGGSYTDAKFSGGANDGERIPLVPEWKANAGVEVKPLSGLRLKLQYNYVGDRVFGSDYANTQKEMEAYQTVDAYLSYTYKKLEFFFNAANIFNENYSTYGFYSAFTNDYYYYPMPEAEYFAGIRIRY